MEESTEDCAKGIFLYIPLYFLLLLLKELLSKREFYVALQCFVSCLYFMTWIYLIYTRTFHFLERFKIDRHEND